MSVVCGKCNYLRKEVEYVPEWQCPSCGVAYNKVNKAQVNQAEAKQNTNNPINHIQQTDTGTEAQAVITGQSYMVYGVLLSLLLFSFKFLFNDTLFSIFSGLLLFLMIFGILKILSNLGEKTIFKVIYIIFLFFPLLNLFVLFSVNSRAKKYLKEQGYNVGALGLKDAFLTAPRFYGILFLAILVATPLKIQQINSPEFLAKRLNSKLKVPMAINADIRLDSFTAAGKTLVYKYTLVNYSQKFATSELQTVLSDKVVKKHLCDIYFLEPNLTGHKSELILMANYYNRFNDLVITEQILVSQC